MEDLLREIESAQRIVAEIERQLSYHQLEQYQPYPKQREFHRAGGDHDVRERLLMAGNQLGKTWAAAFETAMHATGWYPPDWDGAIFQKPTTGWAASLTSQGTRDTVQRLLLGKPGNWGSGAIPKNRIVDVKKAVHGVADSVETIVITHIPVHDNPRYLSDGTSRITIKTYDQGRERWQGDTLNYVWFDEEPPWDIYSEGLTRTNATAGITYMTFTPLLGMSDVVKKFLIDKAPGCHVTHMTIEDALHYTPEQRLKIAAQYKPWERDARLKGIPMLGEGRVFPFEDDAISEPAIQIPSFWPRIAGIDFGYGHPTAVAWLAWDRDVDTVHVYDCYRVKEATPAVHSAAIRARGAWIPVAWPHDGENRDARSSGMTYAQQYRDLGVNMLRDKATHPPARGQKEGDGGNSLEAGVTMMYDRFQTGRLKIAKHLAPVFEEVRMYHRKDGLIVKELDDLLSAIRTGLMMLRKAKVKEDLSRRDLIPGFQSTVPGMGMLG